MEWDGRWCVCLLFYPYFLLFYDQEAQVNVNLFCFRLFFCCFFSLYYFDWFCFCRFLCLSFSFSLGLSFNADVCCVDVILSTYVDAFILYLVALTVNFMTVHCSLYIQCSPHIKLYIYSIPFHSIRLELYVSLLFFLFFSYFLI